MERLNRRQRWESRLLDHPVEGYTDYRKIFERDDVDGVVIGTPDHWHAQIAIDAMAAGKDVYCEKPVTLTIEESLAIRDKALETGRIFQCGAQRASEDFYWLARKFIKEGGIGKVLYAQADYSRNSADGPDQRGGEWNWPIDENATDDPNGGDNYIDWERWLGPAPKRPFSKPRFFQFRKYWDYSGGIATDLLYHHLAPLTIALDAQAPERATASGGIYVQHDDREVPDTYMSVLDYPDDYSIVLTSSMANRQANPTIIRGHRATIRPSDAGMVVTAEDEFKESFKKEFGAEEIVVPTQPRAEHRTNWLDAMRAREGQTLDAETAYRAMAGIKMGLDSYRQDKVIFWDHVKESYVGSHPRPDRLSKLPTEQS
jgi:predicted dehydrogenase